MAHMPQGSSPDLLLSGSHIVNRIGGRSVTAEAAHGN